MGSDDWLAALMLLHSPQVDLRAITVTGTGLSHVEPGVKNARGLVALAQKEGILVSGGRESPLQGNAEFPEDWRLEADKVCDLRLPTGPAAATETAVEILLALSHTAGRKLTVLATGPLTNVAEALGRDPSLTERLEMVYVMGGAVEVDGNVHLPGASGKAEWNFFVDPHAASLVLSSGVPVTLVPLDATNQAPVTVDFHKRLRANQRTPWAEVVFKVLDKRIDSIRKVEYCFWDPLAAAVALDERFTPIGERSVRVIEEGPDRGRTMLADDGYKIRVCTGADGEAFEAFFL